MTDCDEILIVMDIVSTKKTIATIVTCNVSIDCHSIKVKDCYILHIVLLEIILLLIIIVICSHYAKQKRIIQNGKWWIKKVRIKKRTCYYFDDIIQLEDFNLDIILIDEKSLENILIYGISYKIFISSKPFGIKFDKIDGIIKTYDGTRYLALFGTKKIDAIYNRFIYRISIKSSIIYIFSNYFEKIKFHSYDSLPIEVTKSLLLKDIFRKKFVSIS